MRSNEEVSSRRGITFRHVWGILIPTAAFTAGYTWTVGQGGFQTTNKNLCDLWAHLPLPTYQACEFQYALVMVWAAAIVVFAIWLLVSVARLVSIISNRRRRLLSLWGLLAFFTVGAAFTLYLLMGQYRQPPTIAKPPSNTPQQIADLERVRDQLKLNGFPILMRDFVDIEGRKFIEKVRIGVPLRNDAPIGVSYTINNVVLKIGDRVSVPSAPYPSKGPTLLPGESTIFNADLLRLENVPCGPIKGEVHFDISYGPSGLESWTFIRDLFFQIKFDPKSCDIVDQNWEWIPRQPA